MIDRVLSGCLKQPREQHLAVDEMMIPFSGTCGLKQYVPNKPNPEGLKAFVLANPNGIVCDFVIYQGTNTFPEESSQGYSLCESAVLCLTKSLVPGHVVYCDRYFTTVKLVDILLTKGIHCTGTIMGNRIPTNTDLPEKNLFKKNDRGTFVSSVRDDNLIALCYWLDNNVVTMISSYESEQPFNEVKRWSKKEKKFIKVPQPKVIQSYNQNMGGIDLADRMLAYCPCRARTKKWTLRCIMHFIDLALTNAWLQFRAVKKEQKTPSKLIPQFRTFKLQFGEYLINENKQTANSDTDGEDDIICSQDGRRSSIPPVQQRTRGADHLPNVTRGVQKRCRMAKCDKKTSVYCTKCNLYLCLMGDRNCFYKFHTQ